MRLLLPLVAALALAAAGCGADDADDAAAPEPVTVTQTVTETAPATTEEEPEAGCSTSGLRQVLPEQDLPLEVADVRKRIFDAAIACDYDTLEAIALEKGEGFTFSYGDGDSAAAYWRQVEEAGTEKPLPMRALTAILAMPFTRNESGSYAWPTAYSEAPTEEAWQALVDAGLYTQEQVDAMKTGASYLGYRTAITTDGDWQFFVAGD
jgi:hypothetical protein